MEIHVFDVEVAFNKPRTGMVEVETRCNGSKRYRRQFDRSEASHDGAVTMNARTDLPSTGYLAARRRTALQKSHFSIGY